MLFPTILLFAVISTVAAGARNGNPLVDEKMLRVKLNSSEHMNILNAVGFHIDRYYPLTQEATIYALDGDKAILQDAGYEVVDEPRHARARGVTDGYMPNGAINIFLRRIALQHPDIARVHVLGQSVLGADILAIEIARGDGMRPAVKLVANMHGDEVVGRELLVRLVEHLVDNRNHGAKDIVDGVRTFIVPTMNPDGFSRGTRANANYADLNRDFPDHWSGEESTLDGRQPETAAIMRFTRDTPSLVLSANLHGGAVVANYPYDGNAKRRSGEYSATPDDALFRMLALTYASRNRAMAASREFPDGITNGADWYVLYHGMQDWNYVYRRVFGITLELSERKWPSASTLDGYWTDNRDALLAYLRIPLHVGIRGIVTGRNTSLEATISVSDVDSGITLEDVRSDMYSGSYYRLLAPGRFVVTGSAENCKTREVTVEIPSEQTTFAEIDFYLECISQ